MTFGVTTRSIREIRKIVKNILLAVAILLSVIECSCVMHTDVMLSIITLLIAVVIYL
jgi:hypothetical protein